MRCPKCGLYNPESSQVCDCGCDLVTGVAKNDQAPEPNRMAKHVKGIGTISLAFGTFGVMWVLLNGFSIATGGSIEWSMLPGVICSIVFFFMGLGLHRLESWGRTLALIWS